MATIQSQPEFADILKEQVTFADSDSPDIGNQLNGWFDRVLLQSGTGMSPATVMLLCVTAAILLGGVVFVWQEDLLASAIAGIVGFILAITGFVIARTQRQRMINEQLPSMIDELARAAKTGRSLDQCVEMIAHDTPSPLGDEMKLCSRKLKMGMPMQQALSELPARNGVNGLQILSTTLTIHQQTGGDLVRVLERLSRTIRDRTQFLGRLNAATAASRATALLMIILPPSILAFFIFRDPEYFSNLMRTTWGQWATITGVVLEVVGAIWILRILQTSQRT